MSTTLKRKVLTVALSTLIIFMCASAAITTNLICATGNVSTAHADEWKHNKSGWWYETGKSYAIGWKQIKGTWYYFDNNGWMKTGWQSIGGKWYYFKSSGAMVTGWNRVGSTWYYHNTSGAMVTGWNKVGGVWYYHATSGAMVTGWLCTGDKWYYFNDNGAMLANQWIGSYYVKSDGSMATSQWIGDYYVDENGKWDPLKKPSTNNDEDNRPSSSVTDGPGSVIDGKFYNYNGNQVIFSGKYSGECTYTDGWTDEGLNCLGAESKKLTVDFKKYDPTNDTYTVDITFLAHFHKKYPDPVLASTSDEMITISDIEISQEELIRGNGLLSTVVPSSSTSRTVIIDLGCTGVDTSTWTMRFGVRSTCWIPYDQSESYTVKLI